MKELLNTIASTIKTSNALSYLQGRVYIAPETSNIVFFPESYRCPCVVLSDAGEQIEWDPDNVKQDILSVALSAYVYFREPESSIIGSGDLKGVLDVSGDLQTLLVHNLLNLTGYWEAQVRSIGRSIPFAIDSQEDIAIKRTMIMEYNKEV